MKKHSVLIALLLMITMLAGCASSAKVEAPVSQEAELSEAAESLSGGWSVPESFAITEEQRAAFEKAISGLVGANYEPVACLGTQVVAGTNYALLCTEKVISPDAPLCFSVAYIYADLQGGAELLGFRGLTPNGEFTQDPLAYAGGWYAPEGEADGLAAFGKALEGFTGVNYVPIRVIGEQVVSGMNYCVLTQATTVYPGAQPYCALVFIYRDLSGNTEITDIRELPIPGAPEL